MAQSPVEVSRTTVEDMAKKAPILVLHVDDDVDFLMTAKQFIELQGTFKVDTAPSVEEAMDKLKKQEYDVVISDYQIPAKDGLQFLKELREKGNNIPFIIFTGKGREEAAIEALNFGADGYFNKAGKPDTVYGELAHGIRMIVGRNRAEEALKQRSHSLAALNEVSIQLASLPPDVIVQEFLVKKLMRMTGAAAVSFNDYDPSNQTLVGKLLEVEPEMQEKVTRLFGKRLEDIRSPVSKEAYNEIIGSVIGKRQTLTEASFGGIPPSVGAEVQKLLGTDRFIGVAYIIEGELYGTSLLAIKIGMPDPSPEMLESFAYMAAVSLRRHRAEEAMKESEQRYKEIFENARDPMFILDVEGRILETNTIAAEYGFRKNEMFGKNMMEFVPKEYWPDISKDFAKTIQGEPTEGEIEIIIPKGKISAEYKSTCLKKNAKIVGTQTTLRDITERKKALEKLKVFNEKLEVVGRLTIHDVRNKLSAIINNTYLARNALLNEHKAVTYMQAIESICNKTTRILDFAAAYENLGVEKLVLVNVGASFEEAITVCSDSHDVEIVNECHGLTVLADSSLVQLFYNLIDNSLRHGETVRRITIHHEERTDGLELFYEDDGIGIPNAIRPKIFAKDFTTGKGSGYGLHLISRMMEVYGWTIEENSESGKGAKFVITIPKKSLNGKENYHIACAR